MAYRHVLRAGSALSLAAVVACGAAARPGSATDTPMCRAPKLEITLARSAAAGPAVGGYIGFRNESATACQLKGWPALVTLTAAGVPVTARHVLITAFGPNIAAAPTIILVPGARAEAVFEGNEVTGPCAGHGFPPPYRWLRVTPPGSAASVTISAWMPALGAYLPACGPAEVSPVLRASSLYQS